MSGQGSEYHAGYETTKAHQAEIRGVRAQDRLARQALAAGQGSTPSRLMALLRDARLRLWMTQLGPDAMSESGAPRDHLTALR